LIAAPTQVTGVIWPLYARAVVIEGGGTRVAILSVDMNFIFTQNIREIREHVAPAGGLDPAHIMIACTHTHNSFATTPWQADDATDYAALDTLKSLLHTLLADAVRTLQPCRLKVGSASADGLTQNRRPLYRDAAGHLHVGTHGPESGEHFAGVEGPVDDEVKVLLLEAADGRCLGGLVNFAAHPTTMFSEPVYSSSYIGPLTEALKAKHGGVFGFLYGLSGNLCLRHNSSGAAFTQKVGEALADVATRSMTSAVPVAGETVAMSREVLTVPLRRVTPAQVQAARRYQRMAPAEIDQKELCQALFGHDFIFHHQAPRMGEVFVNEILGTWEYQRRLALRRPTGDIEVQVMRLGDTAIVAFGAEVFCEVKHALQGASPFAQTFFASLANGGNGYVPTREAFSHGGYETCTGIASQFVPEASGLLQESALRQLRAVAETNRPCPNTPPT
jgi:hypothetical protein